MYATIFIMYNTGCAVAADRLQRRGREFDFLQATHDKGSGSVAIMLTDGPAETYDHIWVWITEISLLPDDGEDPVVVFESDDPEGWRVDLLDLRDQEAMVTVNDNIPAGHYR